MASAGPISGPKPMWPRRSRRPSRRRPRALPQRWPSLPTPPQRFRKWSRSGGPVDGPTSAGRAMTAAVTAVRAIRTVRRTRLRPRRRPRSAKGKNASVMGTGGVAAAMISANPAPMPRSRGRRLVPTAPRRASRRPIRAARRVRASKAGAATATVTTASSAAAVTRAAVTTAATRRARQAPRWRPVAPAIRHHRRAARARPPGRSQFAVRQAGGAQGAARRQPQGSAKACFLTGSKPGFGFLL